MEFENCQLYETTQNDRWDLIAYKFYGNVFNIKPLIEANPQIPITPILNEGQLMIIPELTNKDKNTNNLPVWLKVRA